MEPVKGSRFVATLGPIDSEDEAQARLAAVQAEWPGASHHCWAWRLPDGRSRSSDAGEPGGSAGRPILARIEGKEIEGAMVIVSRWFGGTKLGVGGLVRAYGGCAGKAIDAAEIIEIERTVSVSIEFDYPDTGAVQAVLAALGLDPAEARYGQRVRIRVDAAQPETLLARLAEATAGRARAVI